MRKTLLKSLFLLCALIAGGGSVWAEDELYYTLNPATGSNNAYANNCDVKIGDITWNITGNSTYQPWRIGGKSLSGVDRTVYSKTAMGSAISKVDLTVGNASSVTVNSLKLVVASDANFSNKLDEVSATFEANSTIPFTPTSGTEWATGAYYKFIFNVTVSGSSNKFVEFTKAEFYAPASSTPSDPSVATTVTIDDSGINTDISKGTNAGSLAATVKAGDTEIDGATVTWSTEDTGVATVDASTGAVTLVAVGTATITATYAGVENQYKPSLATYELTVTDSRYAISDLTFEAACGGSGTANNGAVWTVTSDGAESTFSNGRGVHYGTNKAEVEYVKLSTNDISGTISKIVVNASTASGVSASVSVTVGGVSFGGNAQTLTSSSADYTFVGSASGEIVVTVEKPESSTGALYVNSIIVTYLPSVDNRADSELTWSESSVSVTYGETPYNLPTLSCATGVTGITYSSTDESVATIDASGNVTVNNVNGSTTIKATFAGNDDFKPSSAIYTLNVTKAIVVEDGVFDFTMGHDYGSGETATNEGGTYTETETTWKAGNVTMVADGKYRLWSSTSGIDLRLYDVSTLTFSAPADKLITKIEITRTKGSFTADKGTYNSDVWTGAANSVTFESSATTQVTKITVTYVSAEAVTISAAGYATYCSSNILDFSLVDDLTAYKAVAANGIVSFTDLEGGVDAGQGVLLKGAQGTYQVPVVATAAADVTDNALVGVTASEVQPAGIFVLLNGGKGVGFYQTLNDFTLKANTAYLPASAAGARTFIGFDEATGLEAVQSAQTAIRSYYNLNGQRVDAPKKGLYIVNGKKVVLK